MKINLNKSCLITLFLACMIAFSGCEKEDTDYSIDSKLEQQITKIDRADLPAGITPIRLNSKREVYDLIEKLNNIELNVSFSNESPILPRIKTRSESNVNMPGIKDVNAHLAQGYDIIIQLAYEQKGSGPIGVSSYNANTWVFSSWTQTSGVANWRSANSINYSVAGIIKWYILIDTDLFEVNRRSMSVSGDEPV